MTRATVIQSPTPADTTDAAQAADAALLISTDGSIAPAPTPDPAPKLIDIDDSRAYPWHWGINE